MQNTHTNFDPFECQTQQRSLSGVGCENGPFQNARENYFFIFYHAHHV